jgi:hypothetical protein
LDNQEEERDVVDQGSYDEVDADCGESFGVHVVSFFVFEI